MSHFGVVTTVQRIYGSYNLLSHGATAPLNWTISCVGATDFGIERLEAC